MQKLFTPRLVVLTLFGLVASASACGDGTPNPDAGILAGKKDGAITPAATSGVTGTKTVGSMTAADGQKFCDWVASLYGGYGGKVVCDDGSGGTMTVTGPASQAECLAQSASIPATCTATVSQVETCTRAISTCDPNDDVAAQSACTAMAPCVSSI